jgi:small-conductance mechanosensitive channel
MASLFRTVLLAALLLGAASACGLEDLPAEVMQDEAPVRSDSAQQALLAKIDSLQVELDRLGTTLSSLESTEQALLQGPDARREQLRQAAQEARQFGFRVFLALLLGTVAFLFVKLAAQLLERLAERSATRRLFFKKLIPIVRLLVWAVAIYYIVASIFDVSRENLLAASAAAGIAIGFAAQDVLKNIFGGILIVFDQPFQVGDKVSVGGTYGEVASIGLRSTRLVTPDDNLVSVPNSQVVESQVANANAGALDCQVVVDLYLPGWIDVMQAKAIAYNAAATSKYVYLEKPIVVNVRDEFKETFLTHLKVKAYVIDTRYEFALASDITETAKTEFLRHGLMRPFGDLHPDNLLDSQPNGAAGPA